MTEPVTERAFAVDAAMHGLRLDAAIARALGCSRHEARRAVEAGSVYVDDRRCRVQSQLLEAGNRVRVLPPAPDRTEIAGGGLDVVFEDPHLLVVAKPAGLPTQPPPRGGDALSQRVRKHLQETRPQQAAGRGGLKLGEVHRLDRDVSGLVVYGLEPKATTHLAGQFRDRRAGRRYLALVRTALPVVAQTIAEPIAEAPQGDGGAPGRVRLDPAGMPARTHVLPLAFDPAARLALVLVALDTGRTHQIRVHLAWAVGPIVGDAWYGDPFAPPGGTARIGLHAAVLRCRHPATGAPLGWVQAPGPDFWQLAGEAQLVLPDGWADLDPAQALRPPRAAPTGREATDNMAS